MKLRTIILLAPIAALLAAIGFGAPASAASKDASWIKSAASANLLEIKAGKLAAGRATTRAWKSFGQEMVKDHSGALAGIHALAKDKEITISGVLAPADAGAYRKLWRLHGKAFDAAYSKFAVMSHEQANQLYTWEIDKGRDSDVRAVASKQLPTVQNHLQMADKMTGMGMANLSKGLPKP